MTTRKTSADETRLLDFQIKKWVARQGSAQARRVDNAGKNARHYKHFSVMGVMGLMSGRVMNGSHFSPSVSHGLH
jgi:hypothetical protein